MGELHFIGIGTQRAGTSWLYRMLKQHPAISFGTEKELDFFNDRHCFYINEGRTINYSLGINFYYRKLALEEGMVNGEISPNYMWDPVVPERIYTHFPSVKLLVVLRDPIERAISQYKLSRFRVGDPISNVDEAIWYCPEYRERGLYYTQLQRFLQYFSPEQLGIFLYEDISDDRSAFLAEVERFLGVHKVIPANVDETFNRGANKRGRFYINLVKNYQRLKMHPLGAKALNHYLMLRLRTFVQQQVAKGHPPPSESEEPRLQISEATYAYLCEYFRSEVDALENYLERDLSTRWLQRPEYLL